MTESKIQSDFPDLDIGNEQVTSNECWIMPDTLDKIAGEVNQVVQDSDIDTQQLLSDNSNQVYQDLDIGNEQVTSNECYQEEE
jgi:hypothetical protein